jgi:hypothetical protein
MNDMNEGVQICIVLFLLCVFITIQYKNMPYYTQTLNNMQSLAFLLSMAFLATRLIIRNFDFVDTNIVVIGTLNNLPISEDLIDIRRIAIDNTSDHIVYGVSLMFMLLFVAI